MGERSWDGHFAHAYHPPYDLTAGPCACGRMEKGEYPELWSITRPLSWCESETLQQFLADQHFLFFGDTREMGQPFPIFAARREVETDLALPGYIDSHHTACWLCCEQAIELGLLVIDPTDYS